VSGAPGAGDRERARELADLFEKAGHRFEQDLGAGVGAPTDNCRVCWLKQDAPVHRIHELPALLRRLAAAPATDLIREARSALDAHLRPLPHGQWPRNLGQTDRRRAAPYQGVVCQVCWTSSWEPTENEAECALEHPHEGPHIRCAFCAMNAALSAYLPVVQKVAVLASGRAGEDGR